GSLWPDSLAALAEQAARGAKIYGQSSPRTFDINLRLSETSFLLFSMPAWFALMRKPLPERLVGFSDPGQRERLRRQAERISGLLAIMEVGRTKRAEHRALEGRKIVDIAAQHNVSPVDAMLDLACAEDLETEFCLKNFLHVDVDGVTEILS